MGFFDDFIKNTVSSVEGIIENPAGAVGGVYKDMTKRIAGAGGSVLDDLSKTEEMATNFLATGLFDTDKQKKERDRSQRIIANSARNRTFFNEVMEDKTISEVTRGELLKRFDTMGVLDDGAFSSLNTEFGDAKEGIGGKFRARQSTEEYLKITRDKPGQRQTRFVDSVSNLGV